MTIESAEIAAIADTMSGRPRDLLLVDLTAAPPMLRSVHRRGWAQDGLRMLDVGPLAADHADPAVLRLLHAPPAPVVVFSAAAAPPPDDIMQEVVSRLWEPPAVPPTAVRRRTDGGLEINGRILSAADIGMASLPSPQSLAVAGKQTAHFPAVCLPRTVPVKLPAVLTDQNWVELTMHGGAGALPPIRLRLGGLTAGDLQIDAIPGFDGDQWTVRYVGRNGEAGQVRRDEEPAAGENLPLNRLAVIFDRTCPDDRRWNEARAASLGLAGIDDFLAPAKVDEAPPLHALNLDIRTAVGDTLKEQLASRGARIDVWWFADVPGDGVSQLPSVDLPLQEVGQAGSGTPDQMPDLLRGLTWFPGLDLSDPVDKALNECRAALARQPGGRQAILIVGNSPPFPPVSDADPLAAALREVKGTPVAFRRLSLSWTGDIRACAADGIPVAYLFLDHSRTNSLDINEFDIFRDVQQRIADALAMSGLRVSRAPATSLGVSEGLAQILEELQNPGRHSHVRIGE
ncbi:hypothetical protein [Azospirillum sp. B506]|uniref:hypothetical protein n=1 Tax=Azospirillum sp. B506 TaxID=137721 RepID=UPI000347EA2C|nr:hypothetical protein [Azospirillum sp. B506]